MYRGPYIKDVLKKANFNAKSVSSQIISQSCISITWMKLNSHRAAATQLNLNSMAMLTLSQFKSMARPTSTQTLKSLISKHLLGLTGKTEK